MFRPFYLTLPLLFTTVPFGGTPNRREFGCNRIAQKNSMQYAIYWHPRFDEDKNTNNLAIRPYCL